MSTSLTSISTFLFETHNVRIVIGDDGDPTFVAKDVAVALGYSNISDAISKHCKGVAIRYPLMTPGGMQEARVIKEPDVYRLVTGSRLPKAVEFERVIFEEILPSIRKTGSYTGEPVQPHAPVEVLSNKEKQETIDWLLGLADRYGDDALRMMTLDKVKNSIVPAVDGHPPTLLQGPQPFQTFELLEELGMTPAWIKKHASAAGRLLAKHYRLEHDGEDPMSTPRIVEGAQRQVKLYPPEWRERALELTKWFVEVKGAEQVGPSSVIQMADRNQAR